MMLSLDNNIVSRVSKQILISKINKTLDIKLTPIQIEYIFNNCDHFAIGGRRQGKTTAHCIRLCLKKEPILKDYLRNGAYSDMYLGRQYDRWFTKEFLNIRSLLKENGIKVCEII